MVFDPFGPVLLGSRLRAAEYRNEEIEAELAETAAIAELEAAEAEPTPATHAILTVLKAGECIRHSI